MKCRNCGSEFVGGQCPNCGMIAKKPVYKKWWFWVVLVIVVAAVGGAGSNSGKTDDVAATVPESSLSEVQSQETSSEEGEEDSIAESEEASSVESKTASKTESKTASKEESKTESKTASKEESKSESKKEPKTEDYSNVATEYTLTAGNYTAGVDIPAGRCNATAVSGSGNLSSSNMFTGGVNEMFGIDDGDGFYTDSFTGISLPEGTVLCLNNDLTVKFTYTKIESDYTGRTYDEGAAITLGGGNFEAGTDFPEGVYNIVALSGTGNLSSSNMFDGGLNEMFGIDDGTGFYNSQFMNAELPSGTTLTISGGLSVKLIPAKG